VIVVPAVTHTSEATLEALRRLAAAGMKVVRVGECFGKTEYNAPRDAGELPSEAWEMAETRNLLQRFDAALAGWGVTRRVQLRTPDGKPVWGVEMRAALCPEGEGRGGKGKEGTEGERREEGSGREGERWIVNLSNYLREPQRVQLLRDGKAVRGRDLLNGEELGETFEVASLVPRLVEVINDEG
jgi:hypothetical protein